MILRAQVHSFKEKIPPLLNKGIDVVCGILVLGLVTLLGQRYQNMLSTKHLSVHVSKYGRQYSTTTTLQ